MNIITIDLEEWHTYNVYKKGTKDYYEPKLWSLLNVFLDNLDDCNVKATFFCLGIIARNYPEIIKLIHSRGHSIGCHSDRHYFLTDLTRHEFFNDTKNALFSLEDVIGEKVTSYRAPAFTITPKNSWVIEELINLEFTKDASIFPSSRSYGGFKSFPSDIPVLIKTKSGLIKEFPMSSHEIWGRKIMFSGGGYFRLLPYSFIKNMFQKDEYVMTYFHLRDFDKSQVRVYNHRYLFNYIGINSCLDKFTNLLNDFEFIDLNKADSLINWENSPFVDF